MAFQTNPMALLSTLKNLFKSILGERRHLLKVKFKVAALAFNNTFSFEQATGHLQVIVSLTSHGHRLNTLWIPIECIATGKHRPSRIIVWLGKGLEASKLPPRLEKLKKRGVEFKYVDDIGPHTKYYYALAECIGSGLSLVTIDDDCIYSSWLLQKLLAASLTSPSKIIGYRVRRIKLAKNGSILPYSEWGFSSTSDDHPLNFITGVSGAFYPLEFVSVLKKYGVKFMSLCPKADDVWINYLAAKHQFPVRQVDSSPWDFPLIDSSQKHSLWASNESGGNDAQIQSTYDLPTLERLKSIAKDSFL